MAVDCFNKHGRHFGNYAVLDMLYTEWLSVPVFTAIGEFDSDVLDQDEILNEGLSVGFAVQIVYAHRIHVLSKMRALTGGIAAVCFLHRIWV